MEQIKSYALNVKKASTKQWRLIRQQRHNNNDNDEDDRLNKIALTQVFDVDS